MRKNETSKGESGQFDRVTPWIIGNKCGIEVEGNEGTSHTHDVERHGEVWFWDHYEQAGTRLFHTHALVEVEDRHGSDIPASLWVCGVAFEQLHYLH